MYIMIAKQLHTCDELGACQRNPQCKHFCFGCDDAAPTAAPKAYPFAPGVIDGPAPATSGDRPAAVVATIIALGAVAAVAGFASGYLSLPGWLL